MFNDVDILFSHFLGSNPEGLKVDKPNEFDVMLILNSELQNAFEVSYEGDNPVGYAKLKRIEPMTKLKFHGFQVFLEKNDSGTEEYLSSDLSMKFFRVQMEKAVENLTQKDDLATLRIINSSHENSPAVTLSIANGRNLPILVDYVLSIEIKGWPNVGTVMQLEQSTSSGSWLDEATVGECKKHHHLVAKCPPEGMASSHLWRISFSSAERKLMNPKKQAVRRNA